MFDCCDSRGQYSSLTTLNDSSTWFSSGNLQLINDELPQVRNFSGSSADYGKFPIDSYSDYIVSLSPSEPSLQVASNANSVLSSVNTDDLTHPQTFTGSLDNNHTSQLYRFSLSSYSSFNLSLNGLSANADVELLDGNGKRIAVSNSINNDTEWIDGSLTAGTYYANVFQNSGNTNFRLGLSATSIVNNTRTVLGNLDANHFTFQSGFNRTVISGNGNVDFGQGARDILDLSSINYSTVAFNNAADKGGGILYNPGNGTRLFDAITLGNGSQILFEGIDSIKFADRTVNLSFIPNDLLFIQQQWNLHMMGVQNAWRFTTGSNQVLLGIEDSGLGTDNFGNFHKDLRNTITIANNYPDDFSQKNTSHGTAVEGIIAAASNNGSGISGINWNSPVSEIDIIGGDAYDQSKSQATKNLIAQANQNGQHLVINLSLGTQKSFGQTTLDPEFTQLVANNSNVLFVIAAGNEGNLGKSGLDYPASLAESYNNVIAVGASWGTTDRDGKLKIPGERIQYSEWGSNYGQGLTLVAPSEVVTTKATRLSTGAVQFDFYTGSGARFDGTSAAAPNVSGVASLVWSADPNLSATDVKRILSQTAYDLGPDGYDIYYGSGFVNADAAVRRALAIARGAA